MLKDLELNVEVIELLRDGNWKILEKSCVDLPDDEDAAAAETEIIARVSPTTKNKDVEVITLDDSDENPSLLTSFTALDVSCISQSITPLQENLPPVFYSDSSPETESSSSSSEGSSDFFEGDTTLMNRTKRLFSTKRTRSPSQSTSSEDEPERIIPLKRSKTASKTVSIARSRKVSARPPMISKRIVNEEDVIVID